jgi:hypothetical protein
VICAGCSPDLDAERFAAGTGWQIKPEGACKAEVCVPLGQSGGFDLVATAARLRMALVADRQAGLWALGPESLGDRALASAAGPELILDDIDATSSTCRRCEATIVRPAEPGWPGSSGVARWSGRIARAAGLRPGRPDHTGEK